MTTLTKQFSGIHREAFYTKHNLLRYNILFGEVIK